MEAAFPSETRRHVPAVLAHLTHTVHAPSGRIQDARRPWGDIVVGGETLVIPYRQYDLPRKPSGLGPEAQLVWLAWFTRNNDGEIRHAAVRGLFKRPEAWVAPFIVQLLGEYVIEISADIADFVDTTVVSDPAWTEVFRSFCADNPGFIELSRARATSYWNEYYRNEVSNQGDFPSLRALDTLSRLTLQTALICPGLPEADGPTSTVVLREP